MKRIFLFVLLFSILAGASSTFGQTKGKCDALLKENAALKQRNIELEQRLKQYEQPKQSVADDLKLQFVDPTGKFEIIVHRVLVGESAVESEVYYDTRREELLKQKKDIVYFEVSVRNVDGPQEFEVLRQKFQMEDTEGYSYSSELTNDYIQGSIHKGKVVRGGIAFAVYIGHVPQRLLFNTGYVWLQGPHTDEKVFASAEDLDKLPIFKKP